jgi:preprotein translocase subunit SecD
MNFCALRFNLYLLLAVLTLTGCQTDKPGKKNDKHVASMRIHLENRAQVAGSGKTVEVLRSQPVLVTISPDPVLTEASIINATLLETPGGHAIQVRFDESGTWTLEQFTSANPGRHLVIFSQWSEKKEDSRWLAAPLITRRIASGVLVFTPDASPEEAEKIVVGLNNMAKKIAKGKMK